MRTRASVRWCVVIAALALAAVPILAAFPAAKPAPPVPVDPSESPRRKLPPVLVAQAAPKTVPVPPPARPTPTEPYRIGAGVSAPVVIHSVQPEYSKAAREAQIDGEVLISAVITEDGVPTNIAVTKSLGFGL